MSLSRKDKQSINEWLEGQRGKPQYRPAPTAGIAVAKVVKPLSKKYKGSSSAAMLHKNWPEIVGQRWAKISTPVKFTGGRDSRTLVISAPGAAATLIMAASGPIIERLNMHLGTGHVDKLRLVQTKLKTDSHNFAPKSCLLYTSPSPRDATLSRMPSSA